MSKIYFKSIFQVVILLFCTAKSSAQKVTVSDEIQLRNDLSYDLVGQIDSTVILFRDRGSKYEIRRFDQNLKHKEDIDISLSDRNCIILATLPLDTTFYVFYGFRNKGNFYIQGDQFDQLGILVRSDTLKVYEDVLFNPELKVAKSEDKSKILFFSVHEAHEMKTAVFDLRSHKKISDRTILFKETDLRDEFRSMLVSNKGDQMVIFEKSNFRTKKDKHIFEVHKFYGTVEVNEAYIIPVFRFVSFHSKFVYDNENDQIVGGGIYTQKNLNKAEGIYFIQHPLKPGTNEKVTMHPFENRFDEEIKRRSKDKNEFNQLEVTDIALKNDGGAILITEIKKEYERRASYGIPSRSTVAGNPYGFRAPLLVDYYYEDMALFAINKEGDLTWSNVLHKKQYSHDDDGMYSSFFLFKNPSRLRLVYNDEISTENTVSEYIVSANGQYQRKSVLSTEYVRLQLRFRDAIQTSSNTFIVPSQRSLRLNLVKVEYL
ncbi:MAG: hypothetical protein ABI844_10635 [Saprospiraceae bacterium]